MLVPLSAPEALRYVNGSSQAGRAASSYCSTVRDIKSQLLSQDVWQRLSELCNAPVQPKDDALEDLNREYYALRMPCPFFEEEMCTIYDQRPAACRELLVTSPPERCDDLINNPVEPISVPVWVSTVLGLLWNEVTKSPTRLIPLPIALEWAKCHEQENQQTWKGIELLDRMLDKTWRFLSQSFQGGDMKAGADGSINVKR